MKEKKRNLGCNTLGQVFWGNDELSWEEVGVARDEDDINRLMHNFIQTRFPEFKTYYWRAWTTENQEIIYDYGSYNYFFKVRFPQDSIEGKQGIVQNIITFFQRVATKKFL